MSMNDPDWGRNSSGKGSKDEQSDEESNVRPINSNNNQNGPPDLDELWRDFNKRVNNIFGNKGGGSGGPSGGQGGGLSAPPGMGKLLGFLVVVAILFWLGSGFFIIEEGSRGVVTQFGKYHKTANSGFQWRWPYPIQDHQVVNVSRIRIIEVGYRNLVQSKILRESLMLTEDENIIDIQFAVQYRLIDAKDYLFNVRQPDESVKQAAETAIREVVGKSEMDFVLQVGREEVAIRTRELIQEILDRYGVGIIVNGVTVQNVQPPDQVQASFDDVVKAKQDSERMMSEGRAYANDIIPRARGSASRLLEEANGYKERVVAQARGDASRFTSVLNEYKQMPDVTRQRLYLETMQQVFSNVSKVLVTSKENNQMLYLPLDQLMRQNQNGDMSGDRMQRNKGARDRNDALNPLTLPMTQQQNDEREYQESLRNRDRGGR